MVCWLAYQRQQKEESKERAPKRDRSASRLARPSVQQMGLSEVAAAAPQNGSNND